MSLRNRLGDEIRRARLARGLTLREAAPLCGISFQMLGQIELGRENTTIDAAERITAALGSTLDLAADTLPAIPRDRRAVVDRFLRLLPRLPDEDLDVFTHQLALWERRYSGENGR